MSDDQIDGFNAWAEAVLKVVGVSGMSEDQVIPTWPEGVDGPALTVGMVRAAHARYAGGGEAERPLGAVHNGRVLMGGLENNYDFVCVTGPLRGCVEWAELQRCFTAMAEYIEHPAAQQGGNS